MITGFKAENALKREGEAARLLPSRYLWLGRSHFGDPVGAIDLCRKLGASDPPQVCHASGTHPDLPSQVGAVESATGRMVG